MRCISLFSSFIIVKRRPEACCTLHNKPKGNRSRLPSVFSLAIIYRFTFFPIVGSPVSEAQANRIHGMTIQLESLIRLVTHRVKTCIQRESRGGWRWCITYQRIIAISLDVWPKLDPGWTLLCTIDAFKLKFKVTIHLHLTSARSSLSKNGIQ